MKRWTFGPGEKLSSPNPMITDVDTALKEIADWYVKNRREMMPDELEPILMKHCGTEAEVEKFIKFLETEPGQLRFKTHLRERKGGNPRLDALKEILATTTVDEAIALRRKYRDVWLSPDDLEVINRHLSSLREEATRFKPGEIVRYKGEKVRVEEHIGDRVSIWIPSRQEAVWVKAERLER